MSDTAAARLAERADVLRACGADAGVVGELLEYNDNVFDHDYLPGPIELPLDDEPHIGDWQGYAAAAEQTSILEALKTPLPELRFPVRRGMRENETYAATTRKGVETPASEATGIELENPAGLRLFLNQTAGGRVPVLVSAARADFVSLVQAIVHHNEPEDVPDSMGACMIGGHNNWNRLNAIRDGWLAQNPLGDWGAEFQRLVPQKPLYQDQLLLLSDGPYSAVEASELDLSEDAWSERSLAIRMNHECTHYATRRLFGSARNRALDETIADYMGIVNANGSYRADWFLRFAGLERFPDFRAGGRLANYRGDPPMSDDAFRVLQAVVVRAAENIEAFDGGLSERDRSEVGSAAILWALASLTMEEMAAGDGTSRLRAALARARERTGR